MLYFLRKKLLFYDCKFPHKLTLKRMKLVLKFRRNRSYHAKRTTDCYIATFLLLNLLTHSLFYVTSFRLSKLFYSQSVLLKSTNNIYSGFPNPLDRTIQKTKFHIHTRQIFFHFLLSVSH